MALWLLILLLCAGNGPAAGEWGTLHCTDLSGIGCFCATSELRDPGSGRADGRTRYGPANLLDGDFTTPWVEGRPGDGVGESVFLVIPAGSRTVNVFPGHGRSPGLYAANNRPSRIRLRLLAGVRLAGEVTETGPVYHTRAFPGEQVLELRDEPRPQTFPVRAAPEAVIAFLERVKQEAKGRFHLPVAGVAWIAQLEIRAVFHGTRWPDTCISEVFAGDRFIGSGNIRFSRVNAVYVDDSHPGRILLDLPGKKARVLVDEKDADYQIGQVSADRRWATVMRLPATAPPGRVETQWRLLDLRRGRFVEADLGVTAGGELFGPFFLEESEEGLFLEHSAGRIRLY